MGSRSRVEGKNEGWREQRILGLVERREGPDIEIGLGLTSILTTYGYRPRELYPQPGPGQRVGASRQTQPELTLTSILSTAGTHPCGWMGRH